ncbi:NADPH-dependent FMN reductase [Yoonia sp.]|uniref:NADPH-dependent FMN reductase n=1 Tax=Yoonia sp. TaxID=2212373 RepID=UPI003F6A5F78
MKKILFVSGSLRAGSASAATARALIDRIAGNAACSIAEIGTLPHYNADLSDDPAVTRWVAELQAADGVVFITPEYNYSIPGVLKNAIDWASRPAFESVFKGKKCFVISVSAGALGGVRAQAHLKYILNGMLAETHVCKEIVVPMANAKVADGKLDDPLIVDFTMDNLRGFIGRL